MTDPDRLEAARKLYDLSSPVLVLQTPMRRHQVVCVTETMIRLDDALAALGVEEDRDRPGQLQLFAQGEPHA